MSLSLELPNHSPVHGASLASLPVELHLHIFEYLSPAAKTALILTCRQFYQVFADKQPKWKPLSTIDKLELLNTFERDSSFNVKFAYCRVCRTCQPKTNFTPPQLRHEGGDRRCWRHTTIAYFSPDRNHQGSQLPYNPRGYDGCKNSPDPVQVHTSSADTHVRMSFDILILPKNRIAPKEKIESILREFNLPVCPHTWLSDPFFTQTYNPYEKLMIDRPLCDRYNGVSCCPMPNCKTTAYWYVRTHPKRRLWKVIYLNILRHWGSNGASPQNQFWTTQLITLNSDRLDKYWNERMKWKNENMEREDWKYEMEKAKGVIDNLDANVDEEKNGETKVQGGISSVQRVAAGFFKTAQGSTPSTFEKWSNGEVPQKLSSHSYDDEDVLFWFFTQPKLEVLTQQQQLESPKFRKEFNKANSKWYWLPWT